LNLKNPAKKNKKGAIKTTDKENSNKAMEDLHIENIDD
jgi:hypothetical protein